MAAVFVLLGSSAQTSWGLLIEVAEAKGAAQEKTTRLGEEASPQPATP